MLGTIREGRLKKLGLGLNWGMTGEGRLENLRLGLKWEMTGKGCLGTDWTRLDADSISHLPCMDL